MKVIFKFILTLILAGGVLYLVKDNTELFRTSKQDQNIFWNTKTSIDKSFDVVVLGDSRAVFAIHPKFLKYKAYNLGLFTNVLSSKYLTLSYNKVNPSSKNKTIIIALTPQSLTEMKDREPQVHQTSIYDYSSIFNLKKMAVYNLKTGTITTTKVERIEKSLVSSYKSTFSNYPFSKNRHQELIAFTKEAIAKGIKVLIVRVPTHREIVRLEDSMYYKSSWYKKLKNDLKEVVWIDKTFNVQTTSDGDHLTHKDAIKFTKLLNRHL